MDASNKIKDLLIPNQTSPVHILLFLVLCIPIIVVRRKHRSFPSAIPAICTLSGFLELMYYLSNVKDKDFRAFLRNARKTLKSDVFYLGPLFAGGNPGPVLAITHPDIQASIYKKERQLDMIIVIGETATRLHGPNNMQNLFGQIHSSHRKIYMSIFSPKAMESFVPIIISYFDKMWAELETIKGKESKIRPFIRQTQLEIMCHLLFGMKFETDEEKKQLTIFFDDFELIEKALFAPSVKSQKFKDGIEARNRIGKQLDDRFDKIYQERLKLRKDVTSGKEAMPKSIGSAMEILADALLNERMSKSLSYESVRENIYLLLEASHGTTMHVTTNMMYFLSHPDNRASLDKVRSEVTSLTPSYEYFKAKMPYGEACINETLRLAGIVGSVTCHVPKGKSFEVQSKKLYGPINLVMAHSHWYHNPEVFNNPMKFLPERWISGHEEENSKFAKSVFKPFGDGLHICLGYSLAKLVMKVNLYCFARKQTRVIEYDADVVKIDGTDIFPEFKVTDDFPGKVVS